MALVGSGCDDLPLVVDGDGLGSDLLLVDGDPVFLLNILGDFAGLVALLGALEGHLDRNLDRVVLVDGGGGLLPRGGNLGASGVAVGDFTTASSFANAVAVRAGTGLLSLAGLDGVERNLNGLVTHLFKDIGLA